MKIGILEAGAPPPPLQGRFGSYAGMVERLLGQGYEYATFDVRCGQLPRTAAACPAYVITGSAAGVYDGDPWIGELKNFVRDVSGQAAVIGLCFGHQLMAEAYGGRVTKAPQGWGIGLHTYEMRERAEWMNDGVAAQTPRAIAVPVSHQDQIVQLPADARVLGGSEFTPFGVVDYPGRKAVSLQCHPEFAPEYAAALIGLRRNALFSAELANRALATLSAANDRERVGGWLRNFLQA